MPGQCWGLLGRNGAGKTTLLHTLAGLHTPNNGEVLLNGIDLSNWNRRALAQNLGLLLQTRIMQFPATVLSVVMAGRYPHLGFWGTPSVHDWEFAEAALAQVGLKNLQDRLIDSLSGGEQQRIFFAAILAQNPHILLLDEPVAHLDLAEQYRLLFLLKNLAQQGHSVMLSLHDLNQALSVCDHLLILHRGRSFCGPTAQLGRARLLSRIFGIDLIQLQISGRTMLVPNAIL